MDEFGDGAAEAWMELQEQLQTQAGRNVKSSPATLDKETCRIF